MVVQLSTGCVDTSEWVEEPYCYLWPSKVIWGQIFLLVELTGLVNNFFVSSLSVSCFWLLMMWNESFNMERIGVSYSVVQERC